MRNEGRNGSSSLVVENDPVRLRPDDVARLFEPFWRAEGARTDRQHAGLGLAVVHQIAHAIGLRVEAVLAGDRLQMRVAASGPVIRGEP